MTVSKDASRKRNDRPIRVLVSKLGLDGHDRGALIICRALRDAGMEVIYSGLFCTPDKVANIAIDEDVDVVAMSLLNGAHLQLFPKVKSLLLKAGAKNILVIGGGIIPRNDKKILESQGVKGNFGPGTPLHQIIEFIRSNARKGSMSEMQVSYD
jgi:methylmalonyl-CoA mutase C-terminal domain/subunit